MSVCLRLRWAGLCLALLGFGWGWAAHGSAAEPPSAIGQTVAGPSADRRITPPPGFRKLGPGIETTIRPPVDAHDTVTYHNVVELTTEGVLPDQVWTPAHTSQTKTLQVLATDRPFRRSVWYLEFTFKPLRLIEVDLPDDKGRLQRRVVWYMVYRVKNVGGHLKPADKAAEEGQAPTAPEVEAVDDLGQPIFFFPKFTLEADIEGQHKVYPDQILPLAMEPIRKREDPNRKLLDTVEMANGPIPLSTANDDRSVWGVATWVGVDPRIDFFSIYVKGLTNAYRWTDPAGAYKAGDPPTTGRQFKYKTLQLNFWRPGDEFALREDEIHYGARADKVVKSADPDRPAADKPPEPEVGQPTGPNNWDKIIDSRWIFR